MRDISHDRFSGDSLSAIDASLPIPMPIDFRNLRGVFSPGFRGSVRYFPMFSPLPKTPMKDEKPFIEDGSQFGISREAFKGETRDRKRELMVHWFHQNFEDPAERTPYESAEGGYQWIWGGPFDAREELSDAFGDMVPESLIDEVVAEIEEDGTLDWAPTPGPGDYEDHEPDDELPSLDFYLDEGSPDYGGPADLAARAVAREALERLRQAIDAPRPVGMGHNNPPADLEEPSEISVLRPALVELQREFEKPTPEIGVIRRSAAVLRSALIATGKWTLRKLDKAVDAAVTVGTAGVIGMIGARYSEPLKAAFDSIVAWLEIAAKTLF